MPPERITRNKEGRRVRKQGWLAFLGPAVVTAVRGLASFTDMAVVRLPGIDDGVSAVHADANI